MAVRGLVCSLDRLLCCSCNAFNESSIISARPLINFQQTRGKRKNTPRRNALQPWYVKRRFEEAPFLEPLTPENQEFLQNVVNDQYINKASPLKDEQWPRNNWTFDTKRTGVLAIKIGKFPQWKKDGTKILCTLLQIVDNHVINYLTPEELKKTHGHSPYLMNKNYGAVIVGALSCNPWSSTKEYHSLFLEAGVAPKRKLTKFFVTPNAAVKPGTPLNVNHFQVGKYVDVSARTIDHGFQGVVKRFDFKCGPASHGSTKFHRRIGTVSSGKQKGLYKGKKMPGLMGNVWNQQVGLKIWRINTKHNVLFVSAGVPGPNHCVVRIKDTCLLKYREIYKENNEMFPMPTFYTDDIQKPLPEDIFDEELHQFTDSSIKFEEVENEAKKIEKKQ